MIVRVRIIICIFFIGSFVRPQSASEVIHLLENEIGYGARSLSMGGSYTALSNDPSGMYWNPAGLASMKSGALYVETHNLHYSNNTTYFGQLKENPLRMGRLNGFGFTFPVPTIRGSLVLGFGFNRILHYDALMSFSGFSNIDNALTFPINGNNIPFSKDVNRDETIASTGSVDIWTLSFGIALAENLSGGLSISRVSGKEDYNFLFGQSDVNDIYNQYPSDFSSYDLRQTLITSIRSWHIVGGIKAIISDNLQFGLGLFLPMKLNVEEQHATDETMIFDNKEEFGVIENGYYTYQLKIPMSIDLGAAFRINNLIFTTGIRMKDWSNTKFNLKGLEVSSDDYDYFQTENIYIAKDYGLTIQAKLGLEYLLKISDSFGVNIRAGYNEIPSPEKSKMQEEATETISFGIGMPISSDIMLNVTVLNANWQKTSADSYAPSSVLEDIDAKKFFVNIAYLFN
tara:strand:+ start:1 stop:1371 length:1371 start_codon:yes stop_codon:yes gene_type:complete